MQLKYSITENDENQSFFAERKTIPYFGVDWHYHEEYELLYPIIGTGVRIVGDSMEYFNENELVLLGSQLPHLFKNEINDSSREVDYIVIKFKPYIINAFVDNFPEFYKIKQMLEIARRGLIFESMDSYLLLKDITRICELRGADRIIQLLKTLVKLSNINQRRCLASENFYPTTGNADKVDRLQRVINFIAKNYVKEISLKELSDLTFMTTNSFCRFFKERTGKTAFQFLREYRISRACQMIINSRKSISQICHDTGFNSFSSFNRAFKSVKGLSASEYKSKYKRLNSL